MSFLTRHRVVFGGLAIGLAAGFFFILKDVFTGGFSGDLVFNVGYVTGTFFASILIFGTVGGFLIWFVTKVGGRNAKGS